VYGYRKLHDDLRSAGETCSANRVARLASIAGVKAQIGYKRKASFYGANKLGASQFHRYLSVENLVPKVSGRSEYAA